MPLLLLCIAFLISCHKPSEPVIPGDLPGAATVLVNQTDTELRRIAEDARNNLPFFFRHVTRAEAGEHGFYVKHPFTADDSGGGVNMEQIWLGGIHFKNGIYYGFIVSTPQYLRGKKRGDKIIFVPDTVTDWMYIRNEKIIGGLSMRYLLETTPEHQLSEGERELLRMFEH